MEKMDDKVNAVYTGDCLDHMRTMPDKSVNLVVTSPPYATQRANVYGGVKTELYTDWLLKRCREIHRILRDNGVFVLNLKEHVHDGVRDPYVLKTVLALTEMFRWNDTFIWHKKNPFPTGCKKRLKDGFEYCYVFTKSKDYTFRPERVLVKSESKSLDNEKKRKNIGEHFVSNGSGMNMSKRYVSDWVRPSNVITLPVDCTNHKHPATFPISLPTFFIKLFTDEGDTVYDPFAGSGTTLCAAKQLRREYFGAEVVPEYVKMILERLKGTGEKESDTD